MSWNLQGADGNSAPPVYVAAFGKHPGWDDHIDDIGVETERLVAFKRMLYVNGIGGNIDSGAWERLEDFQRLPGFHHVFLNVEPGAIILGRMWSSSDGKGRKRYPMVVCAHCPRMPLPWVLEEVPRRLAAVEESCRQATTATSVRSVIAQTRSELGQVAEVALDGGMAIPGWFTVANVVDRLRTIGENGSGFRRVLYKVEREMSQFLDAEQYNGSDPPPPQHIRVPLGDDMEAPAFALWVGTALSLIRAPAPLFLARHVQKAWIDIIVGIPRPAQLYCLRASREALPPATDIPYNFDEAFERHADEVLTAWSTPTFGLRRLIMEAGMQTDGAGGRLGVRGLFGKVRGLFGSR